MIFCVPSISGLRSAALFSPCMKLLDDWVLDGVGDGVGDGVVDVVGDGLVLFTSGTPVIA